MAAKVSMSPEEASLQLGWNPSHIRKLMRLNVVDLGIAIPPHKGKDRWEFHIYQDKINKITGKDLPCETEVPDALQSAVS